MLEVNRGGGLPLIAVSTTKVTVGLSPFDWRSGLATTIASASCTSSKLDGRTYVSTTEHARAGGAIAQPASPSKMTKIRQVMGVLLPRQDQQGGAAVKMDKKGPEHCCSGPFLVPPWTPLQRKQGSRLRGTGSALFGSAAPPAGVGESAANLLRLRSRR
jgi:hypothetical protein